jgi:hypothetical protein
MPQLVANLPSGFLIEPSVLLNAIASVYRRTVMSNLLISFARINRPQFMKPFELVRMQHVPSRSYHSLYKFEVAFARCKQVAAADWRGLLGKSQGIANMIIHCRRT